jgi:hypothetical protein
MKLRNGGKGDASPSLFIGMLIFWLSEKWYPINMKWNKNKRLNICICYLDVNWLIPNISACRARIWSLLASEQSEQVTNFIFLWTTVLGKRLLNMLNHIIFTRKYKYRCTRDYVWYKDEKHVIWMWIWLILKNISLLDRIWSVWLVRFSHSPTNFIFWLGRLISSSQ